MNTENPIEEVWRARDELLAEHGGDFAVYFAWLVREQEKRGDRLVRVVPHREPDESTAVVREEPPKGSATENPLEEIRRIKEELAAEYDYDVHKMFDALREEEKKHGDRVVRIVPRREPEEPPAKP